MSVWLYFIHTRTQRKTEENNMKTFIHFSLLLVILLWGCKNNATDPSGSSNTVTDRDGNVYHNVIIGTQTWMVENLKTTKYRNGDAILYTINDITSGAYCDYDNKAANGTKYGHLYNYYAVIDSRNIAPSGWHIPTKAELETLALTVGSNGNALKVAGQGIEYGVGTNSSGFSALMSGMHYHTNIFDALEMNTYFWSSTEDDAANAFSMNMGYSTSGISIYGGAYKGFGYSVRCVKD